MVIQKADVSVNSSLLYVSYCEISWLLHHDFTGLRRKCHVSGTIFLKFSVDLFGHIIVFLMSCDFITSSSSLLFHCLCIFKRLMKFHVQYHQSKLLVIKSRIPLLQLPTFAFTVLCPSSLEGLGVMVAGVIVWRHVPVVHYDRSEPGFQPYIFMTTLGTLPRPHLDFPGHVQLKSLR